MRKKLLISALLVLVLSPVLAADGELTFRWSYPYNGSTYRVYTARLAYIVYVLEVGVDGFQERDLRNNPMDSVVLSGDADEGDVYITPLHPTCWSVDINTDYLLLNWTRKDERPCYQYYFPAVGNTQVFTGTK